MQERKTRQIVENKEFFTDLLNYHANNPLGDAFRQESGPKLFGGSARFFGNYVDLLDVSYVFLRTLKLPLDEICNIICSNPRETIPNNLLELYEEALLHSNHKEEISGLLNFLFRIKKNLRKKNYSQ